MFWFEFIVTLVVDDLLLFNVKFDLIGSFNLFKSAAMSSWFSIVCTGFSIYVFTGTSCKPLKNGCLSIFRKI